MQFPNEPADLNIVATQDGDDFIFTVTGERADEVEAGAAMRVQEDISFIVGTDDFQYVTEEAAEEDGEQVFLFRVDAEGESDLTFRLYDYVNDEYTLISVNGAPTAREITLDLPVRSPSMQTGLHLSCVPRRCRLAAWAL